MLYFRVRDHSQSGVDMPLAYGAVPFSSLTTGTTFYYVSSIFSASQLKPNFSNQYKVMMMMYFLI